MSGFLVLRALLEVFTANGQPSSNRYVRKVYLPFHTDRFAVPPQSPRAPSWRSILQALSISCASSRTASWAGGNTVAYQGRTLQTPGSPARANHVKANVKMLEHPDGTL